MSLSALFELDLITPRQAVDEIWRQAGSRYHARLLIADAVHRGEVTVYAEKVYEIEEAQPTLEWDDLIAEGTLHYDAAEIAESNWRQSAQWPEEVRYWDWERGNLLINLGEDLPDSFQGYVLEGSAFERAAIQKLVGRSERTGVGGRKPDRDRWDDFWIAFIDKLDRDEQDLGTFNNRNQLLRFMQSASDDIFSDTNVKKAVDKVWTRLVEPRSQLTD